MRDGWFNAEGNYFKLKNEGNVVYLRVYQKAQDDKSEWVNRVSYRLKPELLKTEEVDGKLNMDYEDFYIEPYNEGEACDAFEKEADEEYESGEDAVPARTCHLVAPMYVGYVEISE